MRSVLLLVLLCLAVANAFMARPSLLALQHKYAAPAPAPLFKRILNTPLSPPYPGAFDFAIAAFSPNNSTWILPVGSGDVLNISWIHGCNDSKYAYPLFTYNNQPWNTLCQPGYGYQEVSSAFIRSYAMHDITVPLVQYMYYPYVSVSVSDNTTEVVLVNENYNRTMAVIPTCSINGITTDNILESIFDNGEPTQWGFTYQRLTPEDAFYISAIENPFEITCFNDGQAYWPLPQ